MNAIEEMLNIYRYNANMTRQINPSLMFEMKKYYPESWQLLEEFKLQVIMTSVKANLQKGISSGDYRPDIDIEIISRLYASRVLEIFSTEQFPPDQFPFHAVLREMFVYHIRGIVSPKGIAFLEQEVRLDF
jgi:hypothetical protein